MSMDPDPRSDAPPSRADRIEESVVEARHRELAVEHILFQSLAYMEGRTPGLLDHLEASIAHLGDSAADDTKDDEAVREVARLFLQSLRRRHDAA